MTTIYEVRVSDGTRLYFDNRVEAEFYAKDTAECGFGVTTQEYQMPQTAKEFVAFMERIEASIRPLRKAAENCDLFHN